MGTWKPRLTSWPVDVHLGLDPFSSSAGSEIVLKIIRFTLNRCCSRKVRELWWQGIPPSVRGKVWSLAIGNELNITHGETVVLSTLSYKEK